MLGCRGQGHREANPPALADLVPDGESPTGLGARDQARGRGLQLDERGRVRAPLLRRPRRAREPRDLAAGRKARRGVLRGGAVRASARELLPAGDRVHRLRAGGAADRARPTRRGVRLRRAAAAGAPAGLLGPAEPAHRGGGGADRRQALGRRHGTRALAASGQDRDRDLAPQDDRVLLLLAATRRGLRPQGQPVPPRLSRGPVLSDRPLARARRGARVPALADQRQGLLRDQGRARLRPSRGLRPARLRDPGRVADGRDQGDRGGLPARADRLAGRARLRPPRELSQADQGRRGQGPGLGLRDRVRVRAPADLLGPELARERAAARPAGARRRGRASASRCCGTATTASSRSPRRSAARSPTATARARAAPTAAPSR